MTAETNIETRGRLTSDRRVMTAFATAVALLVVAVAYLVTRTPVVAGHMPADKVAAAGTTIDRLDSSGTPILQDTMKVSSPSDLILSVTLECAILTALDTEGSGVSGTSETDSTEGIVEVWVTIDNKVVPVASANTGGPTERPDGEVVFCNRAYERTVQDMEDPLDGIDSERDFIRTRNANGFNWLAINTGRNGYDDVALNGQNILDIKVWARFTDTTLGQTRCNTDTEDPLLFMTCSEAFVGQRTLIVEPTKLSVHEQVTPVEGD